MSTLVLGATGFIGPPLIQSLTGRGVEAIGASRRGAGACGVALDRSDVQSVKALVQARRVDTIIDLLAFTEADTLPLLDALDGYVGRWVMASSGDVYQNYEGLQRRAECEPIVEPLSEASPLRTSRYPYRSMSRRAADAEDAWKDDYDKIPLEATLLARPGLSGVILRLPMIYGPGDRNRRFWWIISPMIADKPRLEVDRQWFSWRTTYGFVDDVADALAAAALYSGPIGRTFNVGEEAAPDHGTWVARFAKAIGWSGEVSVSEGSDRFNGLDLRFPMVTDTRAFRAAYGWSEPTSLQEALARTVTDERDRS